MRRARFSRSDFTICKHSVPSVVDSCLFRIAKGMAKAVADVNVEDQGGFASDDSNVTGFSHMHDSGTGGVCK